MCTAKTSIFTSEKLTAFSTVALAIATVVLAAITYVAVRETDRANGVMLASQLGKMFDYDPVMLRARSLAAKHLLKRYEAGQQKSDESQWDPAIDRILNFLDYVGMLLRTKVITEDDASSLIGRPALAYCHYAASYISGVQKNYPRAWSDLDSLRTILTKRYADAQPKGNPWEDIMRRDSTLDMLLPTGGTDIPRLR